MIPRFAVVFGLLAGALANCGPLSGQANTWILPGNGVWSTPANWSQGTIPGGGHDVFINSNASNVIVTLDVSSNPNNLTIDAGDQLTMGGLGRVLGFNGSLTNNGLLNIHTNARLNLQGTHNNNASIVLGNGSFGSFTRINLVGNATLAGGGTITLGGSSTIINALSGPPPVLTLANQTINGFGLLGGNNIGIINQAGSLIDANSSGNVMLVDDDNSSGLVNQGTMQASGGGILEFKVDGSNIDFNNAGGVIRAQAGSEVRFRGLFGEAGGFVSGGVVESLGTGVLRAIGDDRTSFRDLTINGNMIVDSGTASNRLGLSGSINNTGNIFVSPGSDTLVAIHGAATFTGGGSITLGGTGAAIGAQSGSPVLTLANQGIEGHGAIGKNSLGIINQASGVIDANVAGGVLTLDHRGSSQLINQGTLRASNGGILRITDTFTNDGVMTTIGALSLIDVNAALINSALGSIRGSGELEVTSLLTNNGQIAPGNSAGALAIDLAGTGLVDFNPSSELAIELASSVLFDTLSINGRASLDGTLDVSLLGGYLPGNAEVFQFLTAGNATGGPTALGVFANVANGGTLLTAGGEGFFTVNYQTTGSGSLARLSNFTAVIPEPGTAGLVAIGLAASMLVRRRKGFRQV